MRKPIAATSADSPVPPAAPAVPATAAPPPKRRSMPVDGDPQTPAANPITKRNNVGAAERGAAANTNRNDTGQALNRDDLEVTLRSAAEGDQHAWRILVDTYSGRVFGLIRAHCNSIELAEEITQSTFCTVVAKIESYTELGRFEQWLFRIAMNRLRDEMRRRKRQARPVEDDALAALAEGEGPAGGPGSERGSGRSGEGNQTPHVGGAELAALRLALTQLSDSDQHIIHLRHSAGLSFKQIAEVLEQPLGTVLARQHRALKKLAEVLKGSLGRGHPLLEGGERAGRAAGSGFEGDGGRSE